MAHAGDIAGVEGYALGRRLRAYWMTDVAGEGELWWWWRVIRWEMAT